MRQAWRIGVNEIVDQHVLPASALKKQIAALVCARDFDAESGKGAFALAFVSQASGAVSGELYFESGVDHFFSGVIRSANGCFNDESLDARGFRRVDVVGIALVLIVVEIVARELDLLAAIVDVARNQFADEIPDNEETDDRSDDDEGAFHGVLWVIV